MQAQQQQFELATVFHKARAVPLQFKMLRRAASFAGSAAGEPSPKMSRTASRRASSKFVANLSTGLATLAGVRQKQDLTFVLERFENEDSDLVSTVATLMRAGHLRQAVANMMEQDQADGDRGKEIPPSTTNFRGLNEGFCKKLLTTFEPGIFTEESWEQDAAPKGKDKLNRMVVAALNVKLTTLLPDEDTLLRYENPLNEYLLAHYILLGRRLQHYRHDDPKTQAWWKVIGSDIVFNLHTGPAEAPKAPHASLSSAQDWECQHPWRHDTKISSETKGLDINVASAFAKAGLQMVDVHGAFPERLVVEPTNWTATLRALMKNVQMQNLDHVVGDNPASAAAAAPPQASPAGSGAAIPAMPGDGEAGGADDLYS